MPHWPRAPTGRAIYARRKAIVEPVFGQLKEARGFRRFHLRGRVKVTAEWHLVCAVHNLGKLFHSGRAGGGSSRDGGRPTARGGITGDGRDRRGAVLFLDRVRAALLAPGWSCTGAGAPCWPAITDAAS